MFGRELGDRVVDPFSDFGSLHLSMRQRLGSWRCPRGGIDFAQLNRVIKFCAGAFDLFFSQPIDGHIHNDPVHPGVKRRLTAKAADRFPSLHKTVLGQIPSVLFVMDHIINHSENACSVTSYQLVECLGLTSLALFYQIQFRHIDLSQSRFPLHNWTSEQLLHSTPIAFGAKPATPFTAIFAH